MAATHGSDALMYRFNAQLRQGNAGEEMLDKLFAKFFDIIKANPFQQRRGIDRVMVGKDHRQRITVEYKADSTAASSGHAFIELEYGGKPGWALTSEADFLCYMVRGKCIYILRPATLRNRLSEWEAIFETKTVQNSTYGCTGLIVPLPYLAEISERIVGL